MTRDEGNRIFPRLSSIDARETWSERSSLPVAALRKLSALSDPRSAPAATGGHPATAADVEKVRAAVRALADELEFPRPLKRGREQDFDRPCGTILFETMSIVTADAASEGVWNFLSLIVLPEIAPWRFPGNAEARILGKPRNALRRLWWRAWAFDGKLEYSPVGCTPFGEDEFVQIMERPALGGNRRTANAIRAAIWRTDRSPAFMTSRSELVRQVCTRLVAIKAHICLEALNEADLAALIDEVITVSADQIRSERIRD